MTNNSSAASLPSKVRLALHLLLSVWFSAAANAQPGKTPAGTPVPIISSSQPAAATPAAAQPAAAKAPTGVVGDRNIAVSDRVPPEQMLSLQAGNDTFAARYIADLSGQPLGAVIVLHASGQHPSWPFTVAALLDDLPLHGWGTMSIELPAPPQDAPTIAAGASITAAAPAAAAANAKPNTPPTNAKPNAQPAAAATPAAPASQAASAEPIAQARIGAAVKYFTDQNPKQRVVLLGFGSGATRAAEWARQWVASQPASAAPINTAPTNNPPASNPTPANPPAPPKTEPLSALIMIAPANRLLGLEQDLPKILPSTELPALDIILSSDPQALADAEARRRAVLHQRQRIYRRLELPPIAGAESAQHSLMVRRVRAWLQRLITGDPEEVDTSRPD